MDTRKDDPGPENVQATWAASGATRAAFDAAETTDTADTGGSTDAAGATDAADAADASAATETTDATAAADSDATDRWLPEAVRRGDAELATHLATQLCLGFQRHDERDREGAVAAFATVDRFQFQHVSAETARAASEAFVDALWAKDAIEHACRDEDGELDREQLADLEWTAVESALAERAALVGIDPRYAELTTAGWRQHKLAGDYWTPHLEAQRHELRAVFRDPAYPRKERGGQSGAGAEATRYLLGVELHDARRWDEARDAMVPYFDRIAQVHGAAPAAQD